MTSEDTRPPATPAARLLTGGRLLGHPPGAGALVVEGDRIAFVGSDEQARRHASGAPETPLHGRLLTPAFVDAHLHAVQTGQMMAGLDLHGVAGRTSLLDAVAAYATAHPGGVVVGQGWDEREWPDPRPPTRTELDRAGGGAAVYLARIDVHSAVVSSALLAQLPDVSSAVGFSADGLLTRDAHHLCRGRMDRLFSDGERRAAARSALERAAACGVAWVHELGGPHLGPLEDLTRVSEVGAGLGLGVVTYWGELGSPESLARARRVGAVGLAGDLCVDGAIGSRTAALWEPYTDATQAAGPAVATADGRDPHRGARYLSDDEIADHVELCTREGLQAGFHCIGDEAVAAAVDGLRRAAARLGSDRVRAARHRLEHVEMVAPADLATLAALGVVASVQPTFDALWGAPDGLYRARLGQRAAGMNPLASLQSAGVRLAFGTDAPVTPVAGWETVRSAVQHWRPDERLTPAVAFDAATRGGHAAAREDRAGTL
ncbi:MAG: hypothetical protein JWP61_282, partial [Friedmanniella sp.]|nr:hypothetical protein [Friedmanniella sp.]